MPYFCSFVLLRFDIVTIAIQEEEDIIDLVFKLKQK
jgi:hypothetical protein